jgi:type II secretory ATPase GspE/PulE/Tfp pilus assembly ATPase PilB-like protein
MAAQSGGQWVDGVLAAAAKLTETSDLALEPLDDGALAVRARIAGIYRDLGACAAEQAPAAIARLKALAGLPAYILDEPQDGRIDGRPFGLAGDIRAAFLPTVRGARAALRLPAIGALPSPHALGLPEAVVAGLRAALRAPQGLVLVCGPTGSGKTTTIHSLLAELAAERPDRLPLAIEDPVERRLRGVVQVEVRPHLNYGFAEALRAAVRQDPDVLVIGEVRDPTTAQAAVRATLTGHLVVTTLHCGRAAEALPRLIEMGVAPELLLPALTGVLAQRLVRLVHAACNGRGCASCHGGFSGRRVVADWATPDHAARSSWVRGAAPPLVADLDAQAAALVGDGLTTAAEVGRAIGARA